EFAFGPCFDERGDAWVTLNVGFCGSLGKSTVPWRGWALRVTPGGEVVPVCDGLRSPNGLASYRGSVFTVDNQGDWVATNRLAELRPGSWHGHPATLRWRAGLPGFELPEGDFEAPPAPVAGGGEGEATAADDPFAAGPGRPARQPPAVWFPYKKMG